MAVGPAWPVPRNLITGFDPQSGMLQVGVMAPDFALENTHRQKIRLSDFRGRKNVVLAFHPLAFTPVCSLQMQTYQKALPTFESLDTVVLGISLDAGPSKAAWAESLGGSRSTCSVTFRPMARSRPTTTCCVPTVCPIARSSSSTKRAGSHGPNFTKCRSSRIWMNCLERFGPSRNEVNQGTAGFRG